MTSGRMLYLLRITSQRHGECSVQLKILFHGQVKSIGRHLV